MNSIELTIATRMSYEPEDKKYFFGIGFNGLEDLDPVLEIDFIKDIQK